MSYGVFKALHIISVISWMAGLLYLFRLFIYHVSETESVVKDRFCLMERRLLKIITIPAMVASFLFGVLMISLAPYLLSAPWMWGKLALVMIMAGITGYGGKLHKLLQSDQCPHSEKFLRVLNEVPTLLMILIVFLVVLKP